MKWRFTFQLVFVFSLQLLGQRFLPVVSGSQWYIHDLYEGTDHQIDPSIEYVSLFDSKGSAVFNVSGAFGVIDSSGVKLLEGLDGLKQLGGGHYYLYLDSGNYLWNISYLDSFVRSDRITEITKFWYLVFDLENSFYLNIMSSRRYYLKQYQLVENDRFGNVILMDTIHQQQHLVDNRGRDKIDNEAKILEYSGFSLISKSNNLTVCSALSSLILPSDTKLLRESNDKITYSDGSSYVEYDLVHQKEILRLPYERVDAARLGFFTAKKGNKYGLLDSNYNEVIPPKYDFIRVFNNRIEVMDKGFSGLYSPDFQRVLPCVYDAIIFGETIISTRLNGLEGMVRTTDYKEIFEPMFQRILIEPGKMKAMLGDKILVAYYDKEFNITDRLWTDNSIYIRTVNYRFKQRMTDPRLMTQGWEMDTVNLSKWILKINDSVRSKYKYDDPIFLGDCRFNLISGRSSSYELYELTYRSTIFKLVENVTGNYLAQNVVGLDEFDLLKKSFLRIWTTEGPAVITGENELRKFTYMDFGSNGPVRYCVGINPEVDPTSALKLVVPAEWNSFAFAYRHGRIRLSIQDQKWNYLNDEGEDLLKESLSYAEPFYHGTAIIKDMKGNYGVISKNDVIIPRKYSNIKRAWQFSDTVFLVQSSTSGVQYIDHFGKSSDVRAVVRSNKQFALIVREDFRYELIDNKHRVLHQGESNIILYDQHYMIRGKGEFLIYDKEGNEVGVVMEKPETFFADGIYLVKDKGFIQIYNVDGTLLIEDKYRDVERYGDVFLCKGGDRDHIIGLDGDVRERTKAEFFIDSITGEFGEFTNGHFKWVTSQGEIRIKTNKIYGIHYGVAVCDNAVWTADGHSIDLKDVKDVDFLPDGFIWVKGGSSDRLFHKGKELQMNVDIRKVVFIGNNSVFVRAGSASNMLVNSKGEKYQLENARPIGEYASGQLLIMNQKMYYYLNEDFEQSITQNFSNAEPFTKSYAAAETEFGWTVIDSSGKHQFFGRLEQIHQSFDRIYMYKSKYTYGLIGASGLTIIAPEYDELNMLSNGVIQLWKMGEVFYTDYAGNPIQFNVSLDYSARETE